MNRLPLRVLVVDDQADSVASWALLLRMRGHEVAVAGDGVEALAVAAAHRPHVVLCDIVMPRLDGYGVARKLREGGKDRPFLVALTARSSDEDRQRCREAGFDRHLVKPADPDEVVQLLKGLASALPGAGPAGGAPQA
jgi:CheY-like chemotaxis protein